MARGHVGRRRRSAGCTTGSLSLLDPAALRDLVLESADGTRALSPACARARIQAYHAIRIGGRDRRDPTHDWSASRPSPSGGMKFGSPWRSRLRRTPERVARDGEGSRPRLIENAIGTRCCRPPPRATSGSGQGPSDPRARSDLRADAALLRSNGAVVDVGPLRE